ncbi:hypothetical protein [Deinococcus roseus]|uniref:Uncharacterized protein n=1 Tax=Deinococcus roseus TaxID=392414 RepID=A0ABQ2DD09_9DEIO|nr:hypothetical protein [Deinococcus roseus]GGJ52653.1 hypothetical protein GCM10008938_43260 [Deinococcus roseus]
MKDAHGWMVPFDLDALPHHLQESWRWRTHMGLMDGPHLLQTGQVLRWCCWMEELAGELAQQELRYLEMAEGYLILLTTALERFSVPGNPASERMQPLLGTSLKGTSGKASA